ncbi:phasin family protein [Burkholderiaceae bacterium DAT-1]|nr:phasin family protein [Burkholderiaceae bacterium DAT-1]
MVKQQFSPMADLAGHQYDAFLRLAKVSLDSTERLVQLHMDTVRQAIDEATGDALKLTQVQDLNSATAVRNAVASKLADSFMAYSRNIHEIAGQIQQEVLRVAEENMGAFGKSIESGLDSARVSGPAGSEQFLAALKSSFAVNSAAIDSLTKAAKQVSEFANASVEAATTATANAVKGASKK